MAVNFLLCGVIGWCMEIIWTAFDKFRRREMKLMGNTSVLMFPIYGMAALFEPIMKLVKKQSAVIRGIVYMVCIFTIEYTSGTFLKRRNICPWDYSRAKYNVNGVIRLDYAPLWFAAGLIFEKILKLRYKDNQK